MRIGLLSDAHGNPLGLSRCLELLRLAGVQRSYFLGDAVGYLPGEAGVLSLLRDGDVLCQRGNHEGMLLGELPLDETRDQAYQLNAARSRMSRADLDFVTGWPRSREVTVDGRRLLLVHGSPRNPLTEYVYPDSDLTGFETLGYDAVFMGNTHRPFVARRDGVLVVNVGSCGLPRDQGDLPACAVYDSDTHECEIVRVRVRADDVIGQFTGVELHDSVSQCLHRQAMTPFGTVTR